MSKVSCDIIKDLLPLYHDKVCSNDSSKMVEDHLTECSDCKNELNKIGTEINLSKETVKENLSDSNVIKNIAVFWRRTKVRTFIIGVIGAAVLFTIVLLGFTYPIVNVPTDVMKITEVSQLSDGRIAYHVELTDEYRLNRLAFNTDEYGNFYITPKRPIFKTKEMKDVPGFKNTYYTFGDFLKTVYRDRYGDNAEIKALYYGSPKDNILIWKKGMELPKASKEVEEFFNDESNNFMPY
ncbi:zf-HC2 domain-containing protein [Clostridium peptidivorans]|uniref:zf-HC2 domain-containing protein n=1 Tax=Clostridium peptidivorans TaxID=100174 RepID=UPI000BE3E96A|nr:zf-HC2 domain-containing protein [Clostridium peptidivorans]